jgi:metal-responsive CopG/Arc/MetJ family transcriptional regulator
MSTIAEGKPVGVSVQVRIPPRLLARLDRIIARRSAPKPTRGKVIKNLVRQALNARDNRRGAAKGAFGRA